MEVQNSTIYITKVYFFISEMQDIIEYLEVFQEKDITKTWENRLKLLELKLVMYVSAVHISTRVLH